MKLESPRPLVSKYPEVAEKMIAYREKQQENLHYQFKR